jgi:phospholipase/carboxylesterase
MNKWIDFLESDNSSQNPELTVILFHGFGADAYDLRSLSEVLDSGKATRWLFPNGPLSVPIGPGWMGRAWWTIDVNRLQTAMMKGESVDLSNERPQMIDQVVEKCFTMIEGLNTPWSRIVLGGFSQGSMLATELALKAPESPKALIVLSGNLINQDEVKKLAPSRKGLPFFMSHGQQDQVLPAKGAQKLEGIFSNAGLKGKLHLFQGGHEIPTEVIYKLNSFLKEI